MKNFKTFTYTQKIQWRIRISWILLILMLIYMVIVGETGGDSRIMTDLANTFSSIVFFGGILYIITRIVHNKKLLKNRLLLKEQMRMEQDERNQYLHDKSGGTVFDLLLVFLLFITVTAALYNMPAFYTSLAVLIAALLLKAGAYLFYSYH
ncbi:MAG: hypothetical protein Q4F41_19705 [Eubacteriales bacterium]|nr:hypothetical protein [Eubacteriales bacterium]